MRSHENANSILVFDTAGEPAILLSAIESENHLFVVRKGGEGSVKLVGTKDRSGVSIADSKTEQIRLMAFEDVNTIFLMGKAGEESIGLLGSKKMGLLSESPIGLVIPCGAHLTGRIDHERIRSHNLIFNERKTMNTFTYFAYGSNMSERRLRKRVPSAGESGRHRVSQKPLPYVSQILKTDPANVRMLQVRRSLWGLCSKLKTKNVH